MVPGEEMLGQEMLGQEMLGQEMLRERMSTYLSGRYDQQREKHVAAERAFLAKIQTPAHSRAWANNKGISKASPCNNPSCANPITDPTMNLCGECWGEIKSHRLVKQGE